MSITLNHFSNNPFINIEMNTSKNVKKFSNLIIIIKNLEYRNIRN